MPRPPHGVAWAGRVAAALIAVVAAVGIAINLALAGGEHGMLAGAWGLARYFTITTNLLLGAGLTAVALGWRVGPRVLGGLTLCILLVGVIYEVLLRGLMVLTPLGAIADTMLHVATPILTFLFWLGFVPRRTLRWREPLIWAIYPLVYLAYALLRSARDGRYPYPFLDVAQIGLRRVLMNSALIAVGFLLSGAALVALDRVLPSRAEPPPRRAVTGSMPGRTP